VIELYDGPETLFYCDPPYVHDTRGDDKAYAHEMTDADHELLAQALNRVQDRVAISNYDCALMNDLYPPPRWRKLVGPERTIHSTKDQRREVLWGNYDWEVAASEQLFS